MVWLTNDMPPEGVERCKRYGVETVFVEANLRDHGNKQRHWEMLRWMATNLHRGFTHALTIDARDVVFLDNPFNYKPIEGPGILTTAEATRYADCRWNAREAKRMMKDLRADLPGYDSAWPVINGGHLAGPVRELMWAQLVRVGIDSCVPADQARSGILTNWAKAQLIRVGIDSRKPVDQTTLGFLTNWVKDWNTLFRVVSVSEPWILHGHFYCNWKDQVTIEDGHKIKNRKGELYRLLHQWDRQEVPIEIRNSILVKYGTE